MTHALIIDDDRSNLGVLAQMLELSDINYTAVQNPTKVDDILASKIAFDIIFLDLEMPTLNGYDLFEMIKDYQHLSNVPVVACTVHTNEVVTAQDMGFDSFIAKPLDVDLFPQQLQQILDGQSVWHKM